MRLFYGLSLYLDFYELIIFSIIFHYEICQLNKSEEFRLNYQKLENMPDDSDFRDDKNQTYMYNSKISTLLNNHFKDSEKKFIHFDLNSIYVLFNESYYEKWFDFNGIFNDVNYYDLIAFSNENNTIDFIISFTSNSKLNFYHYQKNIIDNGTISNNNYSEFQFQLNTGITCHMLENENKILICFYSNQYANNIFASCFNIDENYTLYGQTINYTCSYEWGAEAFIISSIIKNQNKFFVCLANQIIFCTIYDNNEKKFGNWSEVKYDKLYKEMIQLYYFEENQKIILFYINIQPFSFNNQGKLEQNGTCSCPNTYTKAYSYYFLNYDNSSKTYHLISNHDVVYNCSINISVIPNFIELNSNENEKIPTMEIGSNQITNTLSMHSETVFVSTHLNRFHTSETIFFTSNNKYDTTTISTLSTKIINSISTTSLLINESSIKTYNINTITSNIFSDSILAGETYTNKNNISTTSIKITNNISTDSLQSIIKTDNINTMTNFIFTDSLLTEETSTNTNSTYIRPVNPTTINSIILLENFNITKENILKEIQSIAENIEIGKTYKKEEEDFSLYIYPTNSTFLTSVTHVNFSECESILRKHYKMPDTSIMTFFQIELKNDDSTSLINQVEYQAYYNNTFLDLSLCNNTNIKVYYSIKDNSLIDFSSVASFKDSGIDIFNINDSFFNDICHPYSNGEDDLILKDRIKDIYLNYSLCEQGCTYNEVDLDYMTIACDCQVKDNISTVVSPLNLDNIIETPSNFEIIKCYNLVFSWDGKLNNIGFWIFLLLVLLQGPLLMYYFCKGIK